MPETQERSPIRPTARYIGHGNYRLDSLCFSRPGWWNVALVVDGRAGVDSVAFNVVLPPAMPAAGATRSLRATCRPSSGSRSQAALH
jgi:hypothetical protein